MQADTMRNSMGQIVLKGTHGDARPITIVDLCAMYCRLCLERAREARQLDDTLLDSVTIREAIETVAGIFTEISGIVPTIVCRTCMHKLKLTFAFRQGCLASNEQMKRAVELLDGVLPDAPVSVDGNGLGTTFTETLEMLKACPIRTENAPNEEKQPTFTDDASCEFQAQDHALVDAAAGHIIEEIYLMEEYLDPEDDYFEPTEVCNASNANDEPEGVSESDADLRSERIACSKTNDVEEVSERITGTVVIDIQRVEEAHETDSEKVSKRYERIAKKSRKVTDSSSDPITSNNCTKSKSAKLKEGKTTSKKKNKVKPVELPKHVAHMCYYCSLSFASAVDLEEHLSTHVMLLPFKCPDCHTEKFPLVCCTLVSLNRHLQSHHFPYRCPECPKRFLKLRSMDKHVAQKHLEAVLPEGFRCGRCGASFELSHKLQRHMRAHEMEDSGRFRCEYCQRAFGTGTCLRRHRRIHTGDKPYTCQYCGKRFNHQHNFANHKRLHLGECVHVCEVCHKSFTTGTALRLHLAGHFPDDPRYGPKRKNGQTKRIRYRETLNAFSLEGTAITNTPDSGRIYQCITDGCQFTTNEYKRISYHRQTHIKRYACDRCGKRFTIKSSLVKHIAKVHDEQQTVADPTHLCAQCGKMFPSQQKLQWHIDSHLGNKPYRCWYCAKGFRQKANCKAHERIHASEDPFFCGVCLQTFADPGELQRHTQLHEEGTSVRRKCAPPEAVDDEKVEKTPQQLNKIQTCRENI